MRMIDAKKISSHMQGALDSMDNTTDGWDALKQSLWHFERYMESEVAKEEYGEDGIGDEACNSALSYYGSAEGKEVVGEM